MQITKLSALPELPVSHDPNLKKKVMVKNGEIPHLTGFSQAKIPVGEKVSSHQHTDMYEVFFVTKGKGILAINGTDYPIESGTSIVVEPKEEHSLRNTGDDDLVLTYFGIV